MGSIWSRLGWFPKALVVVALVFGAYYGADRFGFIPRPAPTVSSVPPETVSIPANVPVSASESRPTTTVTPTTASAVAGGDQSIRVTTLKWNAGLGMLYANGGQCTVKGSLLWERGIRNLCFVVEDNPEKWRGSLIEFASALRSNPHPQNGVNYVTFMGDAGAALMAPAFEALSKFGPEYAPENIVAPGKSLGEDKCMVPPAWSNEHGGNPRNALGGTFIGVKMDGDIDTGLLWLRANDLRVNPDEGYLDRDAVNFIYAKDNEDVTAKFVGRYKEPKKEIKGGKLTGKTVEVEGDAVCLWTPEDATVLRKRGGLVTAASTKDYSWQMPMAFVGIKKWNQANTELVVGMLDAFLEAGKRIKNSDEALRQASRIANDVFKAEGTSPQFWYEMYKGKPEVDSQTGHTVVLGGSQVHDLADAMHIFGMKGSTNLYKLTYETFGSMMWHFYKKELPASYVPADRFVNTRYLSLLAARKGNVGGPELTKFAPGPVTKEMARKSWVVEFEIGSDKLTTRAQQVVDRMHEELALAGGTKVQVNGHTDVTGTPAGNLDLSKRRAGTIKQALLDRDPVNYRGKIEIEGYGQGSPVCQEQTSVCYSRNRRVEIILGN